MGIPLFTVRCFSVITLAVAGLLAAGCSTQQYHDWYEGKAASAAVLKSYKTVLVEAIDGRDAGTAFIGQQHSYELAPGPHTVVVTYADMYDLTADDFEKVESGPVKIQFTAQAGKTYQLSHEPVDGVDAAKAFAKKPELAILNTATGQPVETSVEYAMPKRLLPTIRFASEEEKVFASDYQAAAPGTAEPQLAGKDHLSALKMLQFSWEQASPEERETFLQWIEKK